MNASDALAPAVPKPRAWLTAMRVPFTSVAVVPFGVGAWVAHSHGRMVSPAAVVAGITAVFLLCVGCYLLGEAHDQQEDLLTVKHGRNQFSGGTLLVANGTLQESHVKSAAWGTFAVALVLGIYIVVVHRTPWLFGLGLFGAFAAGFYSVPPIRLVKRGFGELFIGVCYGWLTIATGYACASGQMPPFSPLATLPVALAVFNIILINEFPDYEADSATDKRNLMVRIGRPAGSAVYAGANVLVAASLIATWSHYRPGSWTYLAVIALPCLLALWLAVEIGIRRTWQDRKRLPVMAASTIVLNLVSAVCVGVLVS